MFEVTTCLLRGMRVSVAKEQAMNRKLAATVIIVIVAGGIATEALAGLMSPSTIDTTNPTTPTYVDSVALDSVGFSSNSSASLQLRQDGNATTTFTAYKVSDNIGDSYLLTNWTGPTITPSTTLTLDILIGSSCPSCTLSGNIFTFTSGQTYVVRVYAMDGNQFSFEVTRNQHDYHITLSVGFGTTGHP
jgi:hypothetical protein